jgi:hypothetical protein
MDPGAKMLIIMAGGGAVFGLARWLFRKVFGVVRSDPTAPQAKDTQDSASDQP